MAAFTLIPLIAVGGSDDLRTALDFTTGVLSLVSLTASIAWGLIATDRLLLSPRHRLVAQAVHRATAIAALGFLLLHATVKISLGHVEPIGAVIPFGLGVTGASGLIGFGSLAGFLMVVAGATGALRSALAGRSGIAGRWRALHMLAYPAWCLALMHGLFAGRPAAAWVVTMYGLALAAVAGAMSLRLLPRPARRRIADRVLALTGGDGERRAEPLRPAAPADTAVLGRLNGVPAQRPPGPGFPRPEAVAAPVRPRLAAPAPPVYEAPPPAVEPVAGRGAPGRGPGAGAGISAAYRAVSPPPRAAPAGPPPSGWDGAAPAGPPQSQPRPRARSQTQPPSPPIPPIPPVPSYRPPSYGPGPMPYDTGAYEPDSPATRRDGAPPAPYDAAGPAPYEPLSDAPDAAADAAAGAIPPDDPQAMPGPLFPPPAGEPWNAPAGDRP
ncbi:hypothetical protein ABT391_20300 [Streptomyces jumonjinensis]|uniref:hypothetical protein n=1 Tax=Streptomyces jumonjinensis TaxID=1945 RepID=UPI00331752EE